MEQFSRNVAKKILTFWSFCHIPDIAPQRIFSEDPLQRNHCSNAKTRWNIGCNKSRWAQLLAFSLYSWLADWVMQYNLLKDHLFRTANGIGEGSPKARRRENWKFNLSISNPIHQCISCALLSLIAFQRGIWLWSCVHTYHMISRIRPHKKSWFTFSTSQA